MKNKKALLIIDMQNDFCPGGALGVPGGDTIVPVLNKYIRYFIKHKMPVFATRDWHPVRTQHFKDYGGIWPVHCLQSSWGSAFHKDLCLPKPVELLYKGMDPASESYSAFQAEDARGIAFEKLLAMSGIATLYIGGLATDYCVKSSVLDALKRGFKVVLLSDAMRGVDLKPGDSAKAVKEMLRKGARQTTFNHVAKKK
ncbi:MAG: bifunctional nicotinamidase/pyrazinamidase [Candidatus Omnitrophica bacterium]|nr:bifunctional nicotinamidase/pyrazinamidase [Candidatus Omnitrophota bacterium]